ncbi:MAG: iron dicitrate transport regulator FecR [Verrucomicrobia bacterium]|nr:iron dicitrate transport regulator FecR [Verrucomicrobiota bacterium]
MRLERHLVTAILCFNFKSDEPDPALRAVAVAALAPIAVAQPDIDRALAWQERRLEFDATPLGEIVEQFNRFNERQLIIADPALAALRFGGSFRADDPDTFVHLIETRTDITVDRQPGQVIFKTK